MSRANEVKAAIVKLEQAREGIVVDGDWLVEEAGEHTCAGGTLESNYAHERGCGYIPLTNDPLTVALHRATDPILTILRLAHHTCLKQEARGETPRGPALDMARAINGEAHS